MRIAPEIEMIPAAHGKEIFAREARRLFSEQKFDCVAIDIPEIFQEDIGEAVDGLPVISALLAYDPIYKDDSVWYYIPIDPCDAMIEGVRQARQRRIPLYCVGSPQLYKPEATPHMPDEYAITKIGFDAYTALCRKAVSGMILSDEEIDDAKHISEELDTLRKRHKNILVISRIKLFDMVRDKMMLSDHDYSVDNNDDHSVNQQSVNSNNNNRDNNNNTEYTVISRPINPDLLYFALGELPFVTAKTQMERMDPFAEPVNLTDAIKNLFTETRDNYFDDKEEALRLSPVRIQAALTYLRNLTVSSCRLIPSLFDIVESAKGVGGNAYALRILKSAKYYPFLPIENGDDFVNTGIDRISLIDDTYPDAEREVYAAVNLFRDTEMYWRTIDIKPDPSEAAKKKYRYSWNPYGCCSHTPEDVRLESFNSHARNKAARVMTEHLARTEKFSTSVKDGIDIRETLRNWHTGSVYVKELPPVRNKLDTVVIIFDDGRDGDYPHRSTWFAEHENESTLSFYATNPFDNLIGPGIARCVYGGVSMLFPPRSVSDLFKTGRDLGAATCAEQLAAGSLLFSGEKNAAYIAARPPSLRLRTLSSRMKKHFVWIPLTTFSNETLSKLRRFHVLNGTTVRSWAARFIGDEA